jgi:hypothetical protein
VLERFGDSLIAAAPEDAATDFWRLAYFAYCATSVHGPLNSRISGKITKMERGLTSGAGLGVSFFGRNSALPSYPSPGRESVRPPEGGPPTFGSPAFTPGPPSFNPGQQAGPPSFTPGSQSFSSGLPPVTPGGESGAPASAPGRQSVVPTDESRAKQLTDIALGAFQMGADGLALTALMGAISELQKSA